MSVGDSPGVYESQNPTHQHLALVALIVIP